MVEMEGGGGAGDGCGIRKTVSGEIYAYMWRIILKWILIARIWTELV
jgi:hypothetical protein